MKQLDNQFIEALAEHYLNEETVKIKDVKGLFSFKDFLTKQFHITDLEYLELRSIDSLTDEEAIERGYEDADDFLYSYWDSCISLQYEDVDWLRSLRIAFEFRGVSVEEMLESGKVKLKKL